MSRQNDVEIINIGNLLLPVSLGNTRLVYTKHTFLHYVDLGEILTQISKLDEHLGIIQNCISKINVSNPISYHGLSQNILTRTEYLIDIVHKKYSNLHPHIRRERGLINGIGKINKWLFGTLDSDDEIRYDNAIKILELNQKDLIHEVNLQTSLYKKLIGHYNKSITTLFQNQQNLDNDLSKFQAAVNNQIGDLSEYISFQGMIYQINLDCQNIITFLDNLENAIVFSKLNSLHNSIVSANEIQDMVEHLQKLYNKNQVPKFKNILTFYQFLGTQISFIDTKLVFGIHFPILKPDDYEFYHLFPVIQNNKMFTPKYPYLARGPSETQAQREECALLESIYYCLYNFVPNDNCTLQLLEGKPPRNCYVTDIRLQESIIEQITKREILIIPLKTERVFSKCYKDQYFDIETPSLIKIPESCEISVNNNKFVNNYEIQHGKPLILPKFVTEEVTNPGNYQRPNVSKLDFDNLHEINEIAKQLTPVHENTQTHDNTPIFGWLSGVTVILLLVVVAVTFKKKANCTKKKPQMKKEEPQEEGPIELQSIPTAKTRSVIFAS